MVRFLCSNLVLLHVVTVNARVKISELYGHQQATMAHSTHCLCMLYNMISKSTMTLKCIPQWRSRGRPLHETASPFSRWNQQSGEVKQVHIRSKAVNGTRSSEKYSKS